MKRCLSSVIEKLCCSGIDVIAMINKLTSHVIENNVIYIIYRSDVSIYH